MVFIGKISYPLYLWHFPLLGFAGYLSLTGLGFFETLAVNAVILLCALLSWRFIEQPVRSRHVLADQKSLYLFGLVCIGATLLVGLALHFGRGMDWRFQGERLNIVRGMTDRMPNRGCMDFDPTQIAKGEICHLGASAAVPAATLLWGDSHGEALAPGIAELAVLHSKAALFAGQHGCAIGQHLVNADWSNRACAAFSKAMLQYLVATPSIKQVILVSRWAALRRPSDTSYDQALAQVVAQLTAAGKHVWLVGPVPDVNTLVPGALYLQSMGLAQGFEIGQRSADFNATQHKTLATLHRLAQQQNVTLVLPHQVLCGEIRCEVQRDGFPDYFDDNHLSTHGARLAAQVLGKAFE